MTLIDCLAMPALYASLNNGGGGEGRGVRGSPPWIAASPHTASGDGGGGFVGANDRPRRDSTASNHPPHPHAAAIYSEQQSPSLEDSRANVWAEPSTHSEP